ncbi:MAG: GAF domain-containing protein, partial [Spirochaetota bacterium]
MKYKFVLTVAAEIPQLPEGIVAQGNLEIRRITKTEQIREGKDQLEVFFLTYDFFISNINSIKEHARPSSILLWNPLSLPLKVRAAEKLIFQEISSPIEPANLTRLVNNMLKMVELEEELKRKERMNKELLEVGIALSAERDNERLLDFILAITRQITRADAGSLYLLEENEETGEKNLLFKIAHNDSNPTDFSEFRMPLNTKSIGGYVTVTGKALNIKDAYRIPEKSEVSFNKSYDQTTGYRTKSILTVPMKDHKDRTIGAIQLINRKKDFSIKLDSREKVRKYVESFDKENESVVLSLASQAAVSLENNKLYNDIEALFEGFVRASVKAIESRDPTTSGHSNRVADYTVALAAAVDNTVTGKYKDVKFTKEQLKEIRYASLLHDFGKVGVREHVLVKARKLYSFQIDLIILRFGYIQKAIEREVMLKRFQCLMDKGLEEYRQELTAFEEEERRKVEEVKGYMKTVLEANEPRLLEENPAHIIEEIAQKTYLDMFGETNSY